MLLLAPQLDLVSCLDEHEEVVLGADVPANVSLRQSQAAGPGRGL
jgi:hypothetical protein